MVRLGNPLLMPLWYVHEHRRLPAVLLLVAPIGGGALALLC